VFSLEAAFEVVMKLSSVGSKSCVARSFSPRIQKEPETASARAVQATSRSRVRSSVNRTVAPHQGDLAWARHDGREAIRSATAALSSAGVVVRRSVRDGTLEVVERDGARCQITASKAYQPAA
jgi:hypothetical protein